MDTLHGSLKDFWTFVEGVSDLERQTGNTLYGDEKKYLCHKNNDTYSNFCDVIPIFRHVAAADGCFFSPSRQPSKSAFAYICVISTNYPYNV